MQIQQSHDDDKGIRTLRIVGDFDSTDVDTFLAHVDEAVDAHCPRVLVDASELRFINSTALGSLIRAQKTLHNHGGDLSVSSLPSFAGRVFKTLGLDRKIQCFAEAAEAVAYLQSVGGAGVELPGDEEVGFVFLGAEQVAAAGDEPHDGTIRALSDQRMLIRWPAPEGLDVVTVLAAGAEMLVRFRLPLYHPTHIFDTQAAIEGFETADGGNLLVTVRFTRISDVERRAIQKLVQDLRGLDGEAWSPN